MGGPYDRDSRWGRDDRDRGGPYDDRDRDRGRYAPPPPRGPPPAVASGGPGRGRGEQDEEGRGKKKKKRARGTKMMATRYYCHYCDKHLANSKIKVRRQHYHGKKHRDKVMEHFTSWMRSNPAEMEKIALAIHRGDPSVAAPPPQHALLRGAPIGRPPLALPSSQLPPGGYGAPPSMPPMPPGMHSGMHPGMHSGMPSPVPPMPPGMPPMPPQRR